MAEEMPYAEDIGHYWKTGKSAPEVWMEKAKKVITDMSGSIEAEGYGSAGGRAAYMLAFSIEEQRFQVVWPVLPTRCGAKDMDARRQAATLLYHDIKAKAMTASVMGVRAAFFSYLALPDGRTASELVTPELSEHFPRLLK